MTLPTIPEPDAPSPFVDLAHQRVRRRAEPRASIALAGAGCALAVLGALVLATDRGAAGGGDFDRWPGLVTAVLVIAAGMAALAIVERGPIAAAGTVAAALGVPAALLFLTLRPESLPPYSTNAVLLGSTGAWAASYAMGPGRGRPFFLGAAAVGVWASALQLTEKVFDAPFTALDSFFFGVRTDFTYTEPVYDPTTGEYLPPAGQGFVEPVVHVPDATTIGIVSLLLGLGFVLASRWLDGRDRRGAATPLLVAALPSLVVGAVAVGDDLEPVGTGLLLVAIGIGLLLHGAAVVRRATTWVGAALAAIGVAVIVFDAADEPTAGGTLLLLGGLVLVGLAQAYATTTGEPDELAPDALLPAAPPLRPGPRRPVEGQTGPSGAAGGAPTARDEDWAPPPG